MAVLKPCSSEQDIVSFTQWFAEAPRLYPYIKYQHLVLKLGQPGGTYQRAAPLPRKRGAGQKKEDEKYSREIHRNHLGG